MKITKTIQRRLEALEKEERFCKQQELSSLQDALFYAWEIVLAYYLGGLVWDDGKNFSNEQKRGGIFDEAHCTLLLEPLSDGGICKDLEGATARALKYSSRMDYSMTGEGLELCFSDMLMLIADFLQRSDSNSIPPPGCVIRCVCHDGQPASRSLVKLVEVQFAAMVSPRSCRSWIKSSAGAQW